MLKIHYIVVKINSKIKIKTLVMKETIENLDFSTMTEEAANELLTSLLELDDDGLKESVVEIIDKIELSQMNDDEIPRSYEVIFNNDKVKAVAENLLDEYNEDVT